MGVITTSNKGGSLHATYDHGGVLGMYPVLAQTYPAALRTSGSGFVIGIGHGGSAVRPLVAGALFAAGNSLWAVSPATGVVGLIAAAITALLPSAGLTGDRAPPGPCSTSHPPRR